MINGANICQATSHRPTTATLLIGPEPLPAENGESDNGSAPFSGNFGDIGHEEERASRSVCIHGILELVGPDGQQRVAPLWASARSAQPIAHHGVLPVDSQSPTFTAAIRSDGAACLLGDFYFQRCDVAWPPDAPASAIEAAGSAGEVQGSARRVRRGTKRTPKAEPDQVDWLNSVPDPLPTQEQVDEWMAELPF